MAYITEFNLKRIIKNSDLSNQNFSCEIYDKAKIYFFSKYEEKILQAIQELLKDPEYYIKNCYAPIERRDTLQYVYEEAAPAYHMDLSCERLNSDFENYTIPAEIKERGEISVKEFRAWFKFQKHLLSEKPDVFAFRLKAKWHIETNPKNIQKDNSGVVSIDNYNIKDLEAEIYNLIKNAGKFYYKSKKNKEILSRYSKCTFLAYQANFKIDPDIAYSTAEVIDLLKEYDKEYKRTLKEKLIEYYRLKYNPDIEMDGFLLNRLGFKLCSCCKKEKQNA